LLLVEMALVHIPSKTICLLMAQCNNGIDSNGPACGDVTPD
jgi:hypothetical protein